jgi:hypothetical protein
MHRVAALLLCFALVVATVVAAPAPFPRPPRAFIPWVTGWDKAVDPVGDCRFDRKGERLTITLPGDEYHPNVQGSPPPSRTPRLLRDVLGDFVVEVSLEGQVREARPYGYIRAGLHLRDSRWSMQVSLAGNQLLVESGADDALGRFFPPQDYGVWGNRTGDGRLLRGGAARGRTPPSASTTARGLDRGGVGPGCPTAYPTRCCQAVVAQRAIQEVFASWG